MNMNAGSNTKLTPDFEQILESMKKMNETALENYQLLSAKVTRLVGVLPNDESKDIKTPYQPDVWVDEVQYEIEELHTLVNKLSQEIKRL